MIWEHQSFRVNGDSVTIPAEHFAYEPNLIQLIQCPVLFWFHFDFTLWNSHEIMVHFHYNTRMHSSRLRIVRYNDRLMGGGGCLSVAVWGVCPGGCLPWVYTLLWTEFLTHTRENITFLQLLLRTVINAIQNHIFPCPCAFTCTLPHSSIRVSNFFFLMQFSAKNLQDNRLANPLWELTPLPLRKIPGSKTVDRPDWLIDKFRLYCRQSKFTTFFVFVPFNVVYVFITEDKNGFTIILTAVHTLTD